MIKQRSIQLRIFIQHDLQKQLYVIITKYIIPNYKIFNFSNSYIMKYSQLLKKCEELIQSYNENLMTADAHADQFLSKVKCEDTQKVFLKQVFYGYQRYKGFLKVSNNAIFKQYNTMTNRKTDYSIFAIFTYLIIFRLDQLPFTQFKKMVLSQDMIKMHVLLSCIMDINFIRTHILQGWRQYLEQSYLQEKVFPALQQRKNKCLELISKVSENATGRKGDTNGMESMKQFIDPSKQKKKVTTFQQFNLTKPKPKVLPEVERIQNDFKANPAPKTKKDLKIIEQQKKKRRQQIKGNVKKFYDQKLVQFQLSTAKRPTNIQKVKEEVQLKETKTMEKKKYTKPVPKYPEVDVKLNVAAILRQEKKLLQKIQEEELKMKNLQMNMRDETQHENWKKEMKEKDKYDQLQAQQRRKIQMQLAREAAIQAYQQKIQQKKDLVLDMRDIAKELQQQREKLEMQDLQSKKKIIQQVQQIKENIKQQQQKVLKQNKKMHDDEKEQRKRVQEKKKEEEKIEMEKKKQLIAEIRELQKRIRAKPKTEIQYVSIGLLEQMNLDELKIKLQEVKKQRKQQQQKKRQQNLQKKQSFKTTINDKKNVIMQHREQLAKQKQQQRQKKKQETEAEKKRLQEVRMKSMQQYKKKQEDKAKQKKRQKQKLAKEIKQTQQRRMFLMQGHAAQQANAFMNLEKGEERQILQRQNLKLMQQYKNQSVKQGELKIIAQQGKRIVQDRIDFNSLYNQQQHLNNEMAETLQQQDQVTKAMNYHNTRTYEQKHNENMTKLNPYKTKIAASSLNKSKKNI